MSKNESSASMMMPESEEKSENKKTTNELFEWAEALALALVVIMLIFSFFLRIITVSGTSMLETLQDTDKLIVRTINYQPKYGDIVIVNMPNWTGNPFVKRIIATGGQKVDIDFTTGLVSVDGEVLDEPYINDVIKSHVHEELDFPIIVPENHVFVMGDNRNGSTDSRSALVGCIDERYVVGKAEVRVLPIKTAGSLSLK